jgi:hypothetical protein
MRSRLRRLRIKEGSFPRRLAARGSRFRADQVHPYRYVQEPRDGPKFRVCLHSAHLDSSADGSATAFRLLGDLQPDYYEVFRTPGDVAAEFAAVPAFGHEVHTGVHRPRQWLEIAERLLGDASAGRELIELQAADALRAHVLITTSEALLSARDRFGWTDTSIVTPMEALPLLWAWARGFGDYWDGPAVTSAKAYYWALARALTPNAGPGWAALVYGEYVFPNGSELVSLGQSALVRLATALEGVDAMFRAWQLPADNDVVDRLTDGFDQIVLGVAALLDNLALVAVEYFRLSGLQRHERTLANGRFLNKLRATGDSRARALADYVEANRARLTLHAELRHHAIHRAKLAGIRYRKERDPEEARIRIAEPTLGIVCDGLEAAGEDTASWGITNRVGPHDTPVSFVDQPGRTEVRHSPGEALLDPMAFAPRLVASTASVINDVFRHVSLESDPRISMPRPEASATDREAIEGWPLRAADRDALILTSPVAGLTTPA